MTTGDTIPLIERLGWVVLTRGDRPIELAAAIRSIETTGCREIVVVVNDADADAEVPAGGHITIVRAGSNLGVPGGRHLGVETIGSEFVAFLDDDATLVTPDAGRAIVTLFDRDAALGALALRIVDENGASARRHIPRIGHRRPDHDGRVATFLGGACALRRSAYDAAGGYWPDLFYAHEELDLSWRMHDREWAVGYAPDIVVEHPHLPISRHADGWRLTGRNRVLIARRNLPWTVAVPHVVIWLVLGLLRAPGRACRRAYSAGWYEGWRRDVPRHPISWRTVRRLAAVGRPPIV